MPLDFPNILEFPVYPSPSLTSLRDHLPLVTSRIPFLSPHPPFPSNPLHTIDLKPHYSFSSTSSTFLYLLHLRLLQHLRPPMPSLLPPRPTSSPLPSSTTVKLPPFPPSSPSPTPSSSSSLPQPSSNSFFLTILPLPLPLSSSPIPLPLLPPPPPLSPSLKPRQRVPPRQYRTTQTSAAPILAVAVGEQASTVPKSIVLRWKR